MVVYFFFLSKVFVLKSCYSICVIGLFIGNVYYSSCKWLRVKIISKN